MSKTYELVNPFIIGDFDRKVTADNSLHAAHIAYQNLSQYFTGHMPNFKFSLQRVKAGYQTGGGKGRDYLHFETFEKKSKKSGGIEYVIKPLKSEVKIDNFQQKIQNFLKRKKISTVITSEESEKSEEQNQKGGENSNIDLTGGDFNFGENSNIALKGGKKYVEDEELDPELEKLLYEDEVEFKKNKKKTKKGWKALTGPLSGQIIPPSPITYYRYDPVIYSESISYIPIFTEQGRPKRMVYDYIIYDTLIV
jgi:hypothetical protein